MSKRGLGFVLVLTFLIGFAALAQDYRFELSLAQQRAAADQIDHTLGAADLALANLRAAQASYLATGQGPDFWMKRGTELSAQIEGLLTTLQAATTSPEARPHYDSALAALGSLNGIDQKARDAVGHGERFLASDVVFMDAMDANRRLSGEIAAALDAERATSDARRSALRRWRLGLNAATVLAMGGLVLFALRRGVASDQQPDVLQPAADPAPAPEPARSVPPTPVSDPRPDRRVAEAADVCVDLARVLDGRDVPPLLERAAHVLGVKGLVLWVIDDHGGILRPMLAHGYPDRVLQRLGSLPIEADNVTSMAFRSMAPQVLRTPPNRSATAIAVPLITAAGCVGVLAAEVTAAAAEDHTIPVARMFAAQLATIVGPLANETSEKAAPA